ncbi:MAG: Uma2 family endonuclease [Cyanobacteriota bacterium]|nr:Uma2 family endonuclease [Cyanobacteriota bacterium]
MVANPSAKPPTSPDIAEWQEWMEPDISELIIEDDTPVDSLIQEKHQRFLVYCLYSSLKRDVPFFATANVGLFYVAKNPALVPDVMLSLGVPVPQDWSQKRNRSYFIWEIGKPPDVVIEIVSNKKGEELGDKLDKYARAGVIYYAVFDPLLLLGSKKIQVYALHEGSYRLLDSTWMEKVQLSLVLWEGEFEGGTFEWLRWQDAEGNLLLTGDEQAQQERQRTSQAEERASQAEERTSQAEERASQAEERAARLAELLRQQGLNPDDLL